MENKEDLRNKLSEHDFQLTIKNKQRLASNSKLLHWYSKLYDFQFSSIGDVSRARILEVGSGASPLRYFYSNVISSDIMNLDYLDIVFDAHRIDEITEIDNESLDAITLTNVLHHLRDPLLFIKKATKKLKKGGRIIFAEPYFSVISSVIYKYLHQEPCSLNIEKPELTDALSPLSSANIALPYLIFFSKEHRWDEELKEYFEFSATNISFFTSLSYFVTGGMKTKIPLPLPFYKLFFQIDLKVSRLFPRLAASFFVMSLTKK